MSDAAVPALPFDERTCVCFLVREEHAKGTGGILFVRGEEWAYTLRAQDVLPVEHADAIDAAREADGNAHYFVVVQDGRKVTVYKYPKEVAAQRMLEWAAA